MDVCEPRVRRRGFFLHSTDGSEPETGEHENPEGVAVRVKKFEPAFFLQFDFDSLVRLQVVKDRDGKGDVQPRCRGGSHLCSHAVQDDRGRQAQRCGGYWPVDGRGRSCPVGRMEAEVITEMQRF